MADKENQHPSSQSTEAWLLTLVEVMPQMIWRAVGAGSWTWSSPQWLSYTGQTSLQSSDNGWLQVVHSDDRDIARASWQAAIVSGEFHADLRIKGLDEKYKWFQTRARPVHDDAQNIVEWIGTSTDVDDLRQLQAEQKVLVAELQHRTRNLIAVIHSIFLQTLRRASSLDDLSDRFEDRLAALSRVQGLLSTSEHRPITIANLINLELHALADGQLVDQVVIEGPDTILRNATAQTIALAVHELATNALKHGALSRPSGRLNVSWYEYSKDSRPWLRLTWNETGVPNAANTHIKPSGYGRVLIEQAIPKQLGANTNLAFSEDGIQCTIELPLKERASDAEA